MRRPNPFRIDLAGGNSPACAFLPPGICHGAGGRSIASRANYGDFFLESPLPPLTYSLSPALRFPLAPDFRSRTPQTHKFWAYRHTSLQYGCVNHLQDHISLILISQFSAIFFFQKILTRPYRAGWKKPRPAPYGHFPKSARMWGLRTKNGGQGIL